MTSPDLFPRPPRRMRQPRKDVLRDQLALAATEIETLRAENQRLRQPWWLRVALSLGIASGHSA